MASPLYFKQLLSGRDFARNQPIATQMVNFVYLIGDREQKKCLVVDPAWEVDDLIEVARADGMEIDGALATHYHPDHVGGDLFGYQVQGIARLLERLPVKVHCQKSEAPWVTECTGVSGSDLALHESGDVVQVGNVRVQLIHTPGHTPGSQCFLVDGKLVAGDTLFLQGCGRTDLPGGNAEELYFSLTQRLAKVPGDTVLYPGHLYSPQASATMAETRRSNPVLQVPSLQDWLRMM